MAQLAPTYRDGSTHPALSLAHLSLLDQAPPQLVRAAAAAGFQAVGLRASNAPFRPGDPSYPMIGNQALVDETMRMLVDTGLSVLDVESARITADSKASDFTSLLDLSAQLGARYVAMTCRDPETERAAEVMARMAEQARELALRLALEFTRSSAIVSLSDALAVVDTVGAPDVVGVLFDFLHFSRSGGRYSDVRVDDERIFYAQMCDAPYDGPTPGPQPVPAETIAREARERLLPGDGVLPICDLVQALPCKAVFSLEVPRGHDGQRSADVRAKEVYASARRVLAGG